MRIHREYFYVFKNGIYLRMDFHQFSVVKLLVEKGADTNAESASGEKRLFFFCFFFPFTLAIWKTSHKNAFNLKQLSTLLKCPTLTSSLVPLGKLLVLLTRQQFKKWSNVFSSLKVLLSAMMSSINCQSSSRTRKKPTRNSRPST
jgi:hypothetical protein